MSRVVLFLCHIYTQRAKDQWMIERLSEAMGAWAATISRQFHRKISFRMKKKCSSRPEIYKSLKSWRFWLWNWVSTARVGAGFLKRAGRRPQRLLLTRKRHVFVLACPTRPSCAGELPQEVGRWFCPLNLRLPSGTAFGESDRWAAGA